jgi:hypothetical protein
MDAKIVALERSDVRRPLVQDEEANHGCYRTQLIRETGLARGAVLRGENSVIEQLQRAMS